MWNRIKEDFSYVDRMMQKKRENHRLDKIRECDFSDLYLLLEMYWRTYWQDDEQRGKDLLHLGEEIRYLYDLLYPNRPPIEKNRNSREAGRPKKYDEDFDNKVMKFLKEGIGPTQISTKLGCSKSYVSKLKRKLASGRKD